MLASNIIHKNYACICSRTSFRLSTCSGKNQYRLSEVRSVRKRLSADMYSQYVPKQAGLIRDLLHVGVWKYCKLPMKICAKKNMNRALLQLRVGAHFPG